MKNSAILVFRICALGDFIIATPALKKLRQCFPNHKIIFLTSTSSKTVQKKKVKSYIGESDDLPWVKMAMPHLIDDVITIDNFLSFSTFLGVRNYLKKHYRVSFGITMVASGGSWTGKMKKVIYCSLLLGRVPLYGWRIPSARFDRGIDKLYQAGKLTHHVISAFHFLKEMKLGELPPQNDVEFDLRPDPQAKSWADDWAREYLPVEGSFISLAPGSLLPFKQWPLEKYISLVQFLIENYPKYQIVILGLKNDKEIGDKLAAISPDRMHNLAGQTSIDQSAALLAKSELLIGNDGGANHLGAAMGCTVITIITGVMYPGTIEPWNNEHLTVRHPVSCSPCYEVRFCPEGHRRCIVDISVEMVLSKVRMVLGH